MLKEKRTIKKSKRKKSKMKINICPEETKKKLQIWRKRIEIIWERISWCLMFMMRTLVRVSVCVCVYECERSYAFVCVHALKSEVSFQIFGKIGNMPSLVWFIIKINTFEIRIGSATLFEFSFIFIAFFYLFIYLHYIWIICSIISFFLNSFYFINIF